MRKAWEFFRAAFAALLVWMLAVSDAPALGIAAVWSSLTLWFLIEDAPNA